MEIDADEKKSRSQKWDLGVNSYYNV